MRHTSLVALLVVAVTPCLSMSEPLTMERTRSGRVWLRFCVDGQVRCAYEPARCFDKMRRVWWRSGRLLEDARRGKPTPGRQAI